MIKWNVQGINEEMAVKKLEIIASKYIDINRLLFTSGGKKIDIYKGTGPI